MKIKFFKKEKSFKKKNFGFNSNFYWELAVFTALAMILLSFFFGYRLLAQINEELVLPVESGDKQVPTIDKSGVEKVLNYFSERDKKSTQILNSPAPVIDPSL